MFRSAQSRQLPKRPCGSEYEPKTITYDFTKQSTQFVFECRRRNARRLNDKELVFPEDGGRYDALTRAMAPKRLSRESRSNARDLPRCCRLAMLALE